MITIDQLLESVDLDFEPRFVTKDECGEICIFEHKPETYESTREWVATVPACGLSSVGKIKMSEFENKDWQECIYEVPRKDEPKDKIKIGTLYIDKGVTFGDGDDDDVGFALEDYEVPRKTTGKIELLKEASICKDGDVPSITSTVNVLNIIINRLNQVIDAVNELKEKQ